MVKNLPANAGDAGLIPGLGRCPGGGNGNPLQYFFFKLFTAGWVLVVALGLLSSCGLGLNCSAACGISVPGPGIEPVSPELAGGFLNHWITREVPAPVFLPGKSHGQRSLVGYSPWGSQSWTRLSTHNQPNWGS